MDHARAVLRARQAVRPHLSSRPPGSRVLVACSGGSDSLALALAVAIEAKARPVQAHALTVDHGILPGSAQRAQRLVEKLRPYLPTTSTTVDVGGNEGPEGSARTARYEALADRARELGGPALVLLGHTRDDQAETVLMGLGRGSGPRSIAGMKTTGYLPGTDDVPFSRPFLELSRGDLQDACRGWQVEWWDDPSNKADGPWRTRHGGPLRRAAVRDHAIPTLSEALGVDVRVPLARTARQLQDDLNFMDEYAQHILDRQRDGTDLRRAELVTEHRAIRRRVVRLWLLECGARAGELTSWHVTATDRLLDGETGKGIDVPGLRVRRTRHSLTTDVE